ncbi:MAG TPA: methyltransferase [Tepidisphaeraceae bacterium]|nr:methyltransferase [Tepidisphaeraceae bacterium]
MTVDPQRARLEARLGRRYELTRRRLDIGKLSIDFTCVANPDRVLDEVAEEEDRLERISGVRAPADQLHLPYWAELWDSAIGMGRWLADAGEKLESGKWRMEEAACAPSTIRDFQPSPPNVLDLGCGMGLAGTVAAALGGRVLFADLEPPALLFARLNSLPWRERVRTRRLNWQTEQLGEQFDLILGADILYERKQWDFLEPFWRAHLAPGGAVLLGEPGRQTGDLFVDWIGSRGWRLTRHAEKVETRERPIRLFELRL